MPLRQNSRRKYGSLHALIIVVCLASFVSASSQRSTSSKGLPSREVLAKQYFGQDAPWFLANIPFLEIDDPAIQRVYYYRWKLYRAHIRDIGAQGNTFTEFLDDVPWARHPYTDLNDSSSFHIMEGRWLRDPQYVNSLVDHLYAGGGNDRHFSESIAAATYAWTQVTGDTAPAVRHLDAMQHIYSLWDDHLDAEKGLYWIEPLLDATEYTISSIDASGAGFTEHPSKRDFENGFTGGYSFRPSINAYQFANAKAIAQLARLSGRSDVSAEYDRRADSLQQATLTELWNPSLNHFTDIYQRSTPYVQAGAFVRGRELVGYLPWMYELPPRKSDGSSDFSSAWRHVLGNDKLGGPFGLRTVEPGYPKYMTQYRYDKATGHPECQWNGPSWPFQTSQALTGMANLLQDYNQNVVSTADFIRLLRQYTQQHISPTGALDLQEDYNPDTGLPIVGLPRSHHYNHSTYVDVILTGLLGIRPRSDDALELHPLLPLPGGQEKPIRFFALQNLRYHGHNLSIIFDEDGSRYGIGKGLSVIDDGERIVGPVPLGKLLVQLKRSSPVPVQPTSIDVAVNPWVRPPSTHEPDLPIASGDPYTDDGHVYEAIDGRMWFFPEIVNGWSPTAPTEASEIQKPFTFAVDLRLPTRVDAAEVYFYSDGGSFVAPDSYRLQVLLKGSWQDVPHQQLFPATPLANGENRVTFPALEAQQLRVQLMPHANSRLRLIEFKLLRTRTSLP